MSNTVEIERKFLIESFPDNLGESVEISEMRQGYISVSPVVRIRSKKTEQGESFKLCFKSFGTLTRTEVEIDIEENKFTELIPLLSTPLVEKEQRVYSLKQYGYELNLECNRVTSGGENEFFYAEVEFSSEDEARNFNPPDFLKKELTEYGRFTMSEYCKDSESFMKELLKIKRQ